MDEQVKIPSEMLTNITKLLDSVNGDYYLGKDQEEELVRIIRAALAAVA